jgi:hypothetical protein
MANKYLDLIEEIGKLGVPTYAFGGYAEDAFLDQATTRPHNDLDLLVSRDDLDQLLKALATIGFVNIAVYYEPLPGRPLVLHSARNGLDLEIGLIDKDKDGYYFVALDFDGQKRFRVDMPSDTFAFPKSTIDGVSLQTISPLAQYQIRAGFGQIGSFGEPEPKHALAQKRIQETFFPDKSEQDLAPKIRELES